MKWDDGRVVIVSIVDIVYVVNVVDSADSADSVGIIAGIAGMAVDAPVTDRAGPPVLENEFLLGVRHSSMLLLLLL